MPPRDSQGRIHHESRVLIPAPSNETPDLRHIYLYDPDSDLDRARGPPANVWTETVSHLPSTVPPSMRHASPAARTSLRPSSRKKKTWAFMK
jgi:hypothetical protein